MAKKLGILLETRPDLRITVLTALRKLICSCQNDDSKAAAVMLRFAVNYLSILFNLYITEYKTTDEEAARDSAYETIKVNIPALVSLEGDKIDDGRKLECFKQGSFNHL